MENKSVTKPARRAYPACCNIFEGDGTIILELEMPGVTKDNLEIKINDDLLIIHGIKNTHAKENGTFLIREIRDADYHHEFTIDRTIDRNKIDAALDKGMLTLTLHIKESEKPRKINVVTA
ncbi:MAG: Hsp20/alpha crystallin family protein [Spirochaetales bacterium]|nr:Hsp20/alpha crystallin family protein [Spirochaetales bacterium]